MKSIDLNCKFIENNINNNNNDNYETPLTLAVKNNDIEKINMIIQHPAFDKIKSQLNKSMFIATANENIEIFRILLKVLDNNVNTIDAGHKSLLYTAVDCRSKQMINEILKNEKFDSVKSGFLDVFMHSFEKDVDDRDIENLLYEFDQKHDHLIDPKKLLLTGIRMPFAVQFVAFLVIKKKQ